MSAVGSPEIIEVGELEIHFHVDASRTDGAATVFESRVPAGARVPVPHRHLGYDESITCLAGVCDFTLEGRAVTLRPGDPALFVPRGQAHGFVNRGADEVRLLVVVTPGLLGPEYFRSVAGILNAGGPPDRARIAALMREHGMEPVPG